MNFFKENILNIEGYTPSEIPYQIKLDANESSFKKVSENLIVNEDKLDVNFYPDSSSQKLREKIGEYVELKEENIIVGNGSSEMIDLIMKSFVDKGDSILTFSPTFSMYKVYANIYSAKLVEVPCEENFEIPLDKIVDISEKLGNKVMILCNPNNPTGKDIPREEIIKILNNSNQLLIMDEAYVEFGGESVIDLVDEFENLIVLRTFSKAFGLAGARIGYMAANKNIIKIIDRVRPPYNLNKFSQYAGILALEKTDEVLEEIKQVKNRRKKLYYAMKDFNIEVFESYGNFIFFKDEKEKIFSELVEKGILIRKFGGSLKGYYRVSVGSEDEVEYFIKSIKEIVENEKG